MTEHVRFIDADGTAALGICESLLLALTDAKVLSEKDARFAHGRCQLPPTRECRVEEPGQTPRGDRHRSAHPRRQERRGSLDGMGRSPWHSHPIAPASA